MLGLRWFRDRTTPDALARDHGISRATAYRYLDEVIAVLAGQAPDLHQALERAQDAGFSHVILDGTIIPCDRRLRLADVGQWMEPWRISGPVCSPDILARASFRRWPPGPVSWPLCEPAGVPGARPRFAVLGLLLQEGAEDLGESLWFFQEG